MRARGRPREGGSGEIVELRGRARSDLGVAAECLRSLFTAKDEGDESDAEIVREMTGAVLLAEGLHDLRIIRKALTKKE